MKRRTCVTSASLTLAASKMAFAQPEFTPATPDTSPGATHVTFRERTKR